MYNAEFNDYVYSVTRTLNNGPDAANVIYRINNLGFTPTGKYAVSMDNGTTWTLNDGSFSFSSNEWRVNIPSNACYLLAIYGQVTKSGTVTSNMTEIFQDVYNPYNGNNTKPKCVIVFDDGNDAQYSIAYTYMSSKGIVGTAYVNGYNIGQKGVLTLSQLVAMNLAGWLIANHTFDHLILTNLTDDQIKSEVTNQINFLISNGFDTGAYHLAYPGGYINQHIIDILKI